ncbi:MAG: glycosyltransferase family 4 protein [Thermoleophilia bacterium]|nr:glycosyltransferase family 4 protein [Thermoleophilia bacterium]MDH4339973.1 glycosyltransferase family 4 protein [Thermoleophilia bacterium]MDH5280060.1 glycosyltransferase family 4 protein [Thermoleophilia bacterium]
MGDHVQPARIPSPSGLTGELRDRLVLPPTRHLARWVVTVRTARWPEHSRLFSLGDRGGWSVDEDAAHLASAARRLAFEVGPARWAPFTQRQSVFLASHFEALAPRWLASSHRLGTAYLHGRPGTPGHPEFAASFEALRGNPDRLSRIQVTHAEMHELVLEAGVEPGRVFRIPIGVDLESFPLVEAERRAAARRVLDIREDAFVVGSFQKDGVGWGDGLEPKLIKGPDVLVRSLDAVHARVPELVVLLTGPARGYVQAELERRRIPFQHLLATSRSELARAYHALDVYVVPSRQEGGPKGVLEAMATGVPLVTTRVGMASELVDHGRNGFLVDVEDEEAIADCVVRVRDSFGLCRALTASGRETAEHYAYELLDPAWEKLLEGFVVRGDRNGH